MRTASGKPFEAGTRGFWRDYPNINALTDELGLTDVFTEFTTSAFWSPAGLEATAPVFGTIRPAASCVVTGLIKPEMKIEIEVTAFKG